MKIEWKQVLVALALGMLLATVFARKERPERFHHHMMEQLTSKLKLDPDQQKQVAVISEDARAKINALREEVHPKFEQIRDSANAEIRKVLTPVQQPQFDKMSADMRARFEKRRQEFRRSTTAPPVG